MKKDILFGKTYSEIVNIVNKFRLPKFTASQITDWLYKKNINSIEEMSNLSKKTRELLIKHFDFGTTAATQEQTSVDGTKKYLFSITKTKYIETAYIPSKTTNTLCVSTQIGCKMNCNFCLTGKQGFQGNLSAAEILNQVQSLPEKDKLTNIVYMGMGEPLDNLQNVLKSLEILTSDWGYAMSPRRITVSTIGLISPMQEFLEKSECHLALSLHSPFDKERTMLMPINVVHPMKKIIEILRNFDPGNQQRKISFEYIIFKDINDSHEHLIELVNLLKGIRCRVNLIKFHSSPGLLFESPDEETMNYFMEKLNQKGIKTTIRASRGEDISAACGLLSTKKNRR